MLRTLIQDDAGFEHELGVLTFRQSALPPEIQSSAQALIAEVRQGGDQALRDITQRFEGRQLKALELPHDEWQRIASNVTPLFREAITKAEQRIRVYHEGEIYRSYERTEEGIRLACRFSPLARVGLYVPGGKARYPSTVLMTAVPAKVAGVEEIVMTTPGPSPETLAAALVAGVDRVFLLGGAQAIAALAYGTETVPRVDKIVGPGNAYVTAAKRLVNGDVGIDMVAGPTEVVMVADGSAKPDWVAADLLAQAEHDELAVPILIAIGKDIAREVEHALAKQLADLPRRAIAEKAIAGQGVSIIVKDTAMAISILNRLAPEHAGLAIEDARQWAPKVTAAGAVFVGHSACESLGDYFAGPSHVLPTGGSARFSSPLGVGDFLKRTSFIEYDLDALARQSMDIVSIAKAEGLEGHGRAVLIRTR
jgi:histidinol dehydrogenase